MKRPAVSPSSSRCRVRAPVRSLAVFAGIVAVVAHAAPAGACGVTSGGVAGISGCSLDEHEEETRSRWEAGASYSFTATALQFSNDLRFDERRHATLATLDYAPSRRSTLRAGAGVLAGGTLTQASARYDLAPGFIGVVGGSYRVLDASGAAPFVLLTAQVSFASSSSAGAAYDALDVRAGAIVGTNLWKTMTPYVVGRGFGGPVFWRLGGVALTGTDVHHYQVGAGVAVRLLQRLDVFVEGVALGEQGLSIGVGTSL
jgi:hypothetical protein